MRKVFNRKENLEIKPLYKAGILIRKGDTRNVNGFDLIKIVLNIYEGDLSSVPYQLEFYLYDNPLQKLISKVKVGSFLGVKYTTKSKLNKKTNLYYTNNIASAIEPLEEEKDLINFNKQFNYEFIN